MKRSATLYLALLGALLMGLAYLVWHQAQENHSLQRRLSHARIALLEARADEHQRRAEKHLASIDARLSWLYSLAALQTAAEQRDFLPRRWKTFLELSQHPALFRQRWVSPVPAQRVLYDAALSPDQTRLAIAAQDGKIRILETTHFQEIQQIGKGPPSTAVVHFLDNRRVIAGYLNGKMIVYSLSGEAPPRELPGHSVGILSMAFSPSGDHFATGDQSGKIVLWDADHTRPIRTLSPRGAMVLSLAFSQDGRRLAESRLDGTIRIWDCHSAEELTSYQHNAAPVWTLCWDKSSGLLFGGDETGLLFSWTARQDSPPTPVFQASSAIHAMHVVPEKKLVYLGLQNGNVLAIKLATGQLQFEQPIHNHEVNGIVYLPKTERLATISTDQRLMISQAEDGKRLYRTVGHVRDILTLALSPDQRLLVSGSRDKSLRIWDVSSGREVQALYGHRGSVISVSFSGDGALLAAGDRDHRIRLWDWRNGKTVFESPDLFGAVLAVSFSPDNDRFYSLSEDDTLRTWDTGNHRLLERHHVGIRGVIEARFHPTQPLVAVATRNQEVALISFGKLHRKILFRKLLGKVRALEFSGNGKLLASAGADSTLYLWSVPQGRQAFSALKADSWLHSLEFLPDTTLIAAGGVDGKVRLWNYLTGELVEDFPAHHRTIWTLQALPSYHLLISGGRDYRIRFSELPSLSDNRFISRNGFLREVKLSGKKIVDAEFLPNRPGTIRLATENDLREVDIQHDSISVIQKDLNSDERLALRQELLPLVTAKILPERAILESIYRGAVDPQHRVWAGLSKDTLYLFAFPGGEKIAARPYQRLPVQRLAVSASAQSVASGHPDGSIVIEKWDGSEKHVIHSAHRGPVSRLRFSPDGRWLASVGSAENAIRIWNTRSGKPSTTLKGASAAITALSWLNSTLLSCGDYTGQTWIWSVKRAEMMAALPDLSTPIRALRFSGKDSLLALLSEDGRCYLWDISLFLGAYKKQGWPLKQLQRRAGAYFSIQRKDDRFLPLKGRIPMQPVQRISNKADLPLYQQVLLPPGFPF